MVAHEYGSKSGYNAAEVVRTIAVVIVPASGGVLTLYVPDDTLRQNWSISTNPEIGVGVFLNTIGNRCTAVRRLNLEIGAVPLVATGGTIPLIFRTHSWRPVLFAMGLDFNDPSKRFTGWHCLLHLTNQ